MTRKRMPLSPEVGVAAPILRARNGQFRVPGLVTAALVVAAFLLAAAISAGFDPAIMHTLIDWSPFMAKGFALNVMMSLLAFVIGSFLGIFLGMGQLAPARFISIPSKMITQVFRNAPWLVLLFYCIFLLPFQFDILGTTVSVPNWARATIGFTIPVIANFSEIMRGAVQSVPSGQWEAARSLGYTWRKTMLAIILPQCIKRMLPPWMNLYAILLMATSLASIVGVEEAMTNTRTALQAEGNSELLLPFYIYLLGWFFVFCYPIARLSMLLEARFTIRGA